MSQNDLKSKTIDGIVFQVGMLPPRTARRIFIALSKMLGPTLGTVLGDVMKLAGTGEAGVKKWIESELDSSTMTLALSTLVDRISDEELDWIMNDLAAVTLADNVKLDGTFDVKFMGRFDTMMKWFAFALQVNFLDFIVASVGAVPGIQGKVTETAVKG